MRRDIMLSLPAWETDQDLILDRLMAQHHPLRIVLKTRNDYFFLNRWLTHHTRIVPKSAITIFDNESNDPGVLDFYRRIVNDVQVVRFSGMHNDIHDARKFSSLYTSLQRACDYHLFIDTDEFLYYYQDGWLRMDSGIVAHLFDEKATVYPTVRIDNAPGTDRRYIWSRAALESGVRWGKPIIRADATPWSFVNQNTQIDGGLYPNPIDARFVTIHLSQLNSRQRINSNIQKLANRGFFKTENHREEAITADVGAIENRQIRNYVREIQKIEAQPFEFQAAELEQGPAPEGFIDIDLTTGGIAFHRDSYRQMADRYLTKSPIHSRLLGGATTAETMPTDFQAIDPDVDIAALSLKPRMTSKEIEILKKYIRPAKFLLEFGSGGSTVLAGALNVPCVVSVDSSVEWLEKVKAAPELQDIDFTACHVNIGRLKNWGHPANRDNAWNWPAYYSNIWGQIGEETPDVVFVDGRFRVASVLMTLLKCPPETTVIVHDFWGRHGYHEILKFVNTIDRDDQIGAFKRKADIDWKELALSMLRYAMNPD